MWFGDQMFAKPAIFLVCSHTFTSSSLANSAFLPVLGPGFKNHFPILLIQKKHKAAKEIEF